MTPYTLLLPDNLTPRESAMMSAALVSQRVPQPSDDPAPIVLSVGKSALDSWHDYNLIRVGRQHGETFMHRETDKARARVMFVVIHPGAMMQLQWTGRTAREAMARDLLRFRCLLEGKHTARDLLGQWCGVCLGKREPRQRAAVAWPEELDCVGLCEDHARRKARLVRKAKPRVNPSSREGQIVGQVEGFGMEGGKVMVAKR